MFPRWRERVQVVKAHSLGGGDGLDARFEIDLDTPFDDEKGCCAAWVKTTLVRWENCRVRAHG